MSYSFLLFHSLSVLGDVIKCLGEGKGHVPYRNSILTMVLKESLGGNSHTAIVANVSPSSDNYDETISTLKYADSAKRIRMRVAANVTSGLGATDGSTAMQLVPLLQAEVAKLKELLKTQESYNMQISRAEFNDKQAETEDVLEMKARVHELENQLKDREDLIKSFSDSAHDHAGRSSQKNTPEKKSFLQPLVLLSDDAVDTTVPRIVNLNQDPLFSECLVYYIPSGFATAGSDEAEVDIFLSGPDLLSRHCVFHNHAGAVTIGPLYSASAEEMIDGVGQIFVNGVDLRSAASVHDGHIVRLNHFDRVAIGRFHLFRFEAAGMHRAHSTSSSPIRGVHGGSPVGSIPDWEFAQNELMQKSPKYFQGIALPNFASDPIPQSLIFQPKPKLETGKKKFELQGPTKSILRNSEDYRRVRFSENVVLEKMETYNRSTEVRGHMEGHKHAEVDITSTAPAPVVRQDNSYWSRMERIVQGTEKAANPAELRSMMRAALDMTTSDLSGPSGRYSGPNATFEVAPIKGTGATTVAAPIYTTSPIKAPPPPSTYSPRQHQTQVVSHIIPPVPPVRKIDRPKPAEVIQKPVFAPAEVYHVQDVREQLPTNLDKDVVHNGEKFDSEVLALQSELAQMQKNLQDRMQRYRNMGKR